MPRSSSSSTRASPVRATRWSMCAACRQPATREERTQIMARLQQMQFERPNTPLDVVSAQARRARRHRRGARLRRGDSESQRAATRDADRRGRVAVDPRPGARRAKRTELSRLPIPGRLRLRPGDQRRSIDHRCPARSGGRHRALRHRLRVGARRRRRMDLVRDRAQSAQGRHDASVPHPAVPHRRSVRRRERPLPDSRWCREAPRRDRPPGVRQSPGADASRICSTSSPDTACTSTSRGKSESCST